MALIQDDLWEIVNGMETELPARRWCRSNKVLSLIFSLQPKLDYLVGHVKATRATFQKKNLVELVGIVGKALQ